MAGTTLKNNKHSIISRQASRMTTDSGVIYFFSLSKLLLSGNLQSRIDFHEIKFESTFLRADVFQLIPQSLIHNLHTKTFR